jgi:hypothetical protein
MVETASSASAVRSKSSFDQGSGDEDQRAAEFALAPTAGVPTHGDLMRRLHDRPDDFAATTALQALTVASRDARPHADPATQVAIVRAGLSCIQRRRRSVTRRTR